MDVFPDAACAASGNRLFPLWWLDPKPSRYAIARLNFM